MDMSWWKVYHQEVARDFLGQRVSIVNFPKAGIHYLKDFKTYGNSGAGAICLAIHGGAKRVILLGYDSQRTNGKVHHHGDHPKGLGNAGSMNKWKGQFGALAEAAYDKIWNASRQTALECFQKIELEKALETPSK